MSLFFAMVGQGLPHRKKQSAQQLYSQNEGQRFGKITHEESMGFAKALLLTSFLVSLVVGASALHRNLPWYFVLGYPVVSWVLFPVSSALFCFMWSWMMEKMHRGHAAEGRLLEHARHIE